MSFADNQPSTFSAINNSKNFKTYSLSFLGAMGIFTTIYTIRKHYLRLKAKASKGISSSDCKSENNKSTNESQIQNKNKEEDLINEDLVEKMLEKIKNNTIHTICICIDRFPSADKSTLNSIDTKDKKSISNEKDDIKVEEESINIDSIVKSELLNSDLAVDDFLPDFERGIFAYNAFRQGEEVMSGKYILLLFLNY